MLTETNLINNLKKMPPLNAALQNTLNLLNQNSSDWKKISGTMLQDPVLTGRVLQIANSSFYGSQRQVTDLGIACSMLGLETLRGLLYTLILLAKFRHGSEGSAVDYDLLWKYCLRVACLAKILAKIQKLDSSVAFTAGLFHCMDLIIQDYFDKETILQRIALQNNNQPVSNTGKVSAMIDIEYWNLTAKLLEYWQFPTLIVSIFSQNVSDPARKYHDLIRECALTIKNQQLAINESGEVPAENTLEPKVKDALQDSEILYVELEALLFQ